MGEDEAEGKLGELKLLLQAQTENDITEHLYKVVVVGDIGSGISQSFAFLLYFAILMCALLTSFFLSIF